jgi:hypothetical protein
MAETTDRLNKHYGGDVFQRMHVYYWILEVNSGTNLLNILPLGRLPGEGLNDCIGKAFKEDPRL